MMIMGRAEVAVVAMVIMGTVVKMVTAAVTISAAMAVVEVALAETLGGALELVQVLVFLCDGGRAKVASSVLYLLVAAMVSRGCCPEMETCRISYLY